MRRKHNQIGHSLDAVVGTYSTRRGEQLARHRADLVAILSEEKPPTKAALKRTLANHWHAAVCELAPHSGLVPKLPPKDREILYQVFDSVRADMDGEAWTAAIQETITYWSSFTEKSRAGFQYPEPAAIYRNLQAWAQWLTQ